MSISPPRELDLQMKLKRSSLCGFGVSWAAGGHGEHESTLLASNPLSMCSLIFRALDLEHTLLDEVLVWISQGRFANWG